MREGQSERGTELGRDRVKEIYSEKKRQGEREKERKSQSQRETE